MRERERGGGREAPPCAVFISGALKAVRERELADGCKLHATKNNRLAPKRRFSEAENFSCIFFFLAPETANDSDVDDNGKSERR